MRPVYTAIYPGGKETAPDPPWQNQHDDDDAFSELLPAGGLEGQHLAKRSDADFDVEWVPAETLIAESGALTPAMFEAIGDGVTDDAAALNAMFDFIRASDNKVDDTENALDRYVQFVVDGGGRNYVVKTSLNVTNISNNGPILFRDFTFVWEGDANSTVLDLAGSRYTRWHNCHVWNTASFPTKIGIQQARILSGGTGLVSPGHSFVDCTVKGYFSVTAWMNYASELCAYWRCEAWNYADGANSYAGVFQYDDYVPCTSAYQTLTTLAEAFNGPVMVECVFRRGPGSTNASAAALLVSTPSGLNMRLCYAVSYGDRVVEMRGSSSNSFVQLHMEGSFKYNWYQVQGAANATHDDFEWHEHNCNASVAVFGTDSTGGLINLNDARLRVGPFATTPAWFEDPTKYSCRDVKLRTQLQANLPTLPGTFAFFSGETHAADRMPITVRYERIGSGTESGGAATAQGTFGKITTSALTTAAGASQAITVTNTLVAANDCIFVTHTAGTNTTGTPILKAATFNGTWQLIITNAHASAAFNGTFIISYQLIKRA